MVKVKHICYLILFFALSQVNGRIVSSQTISGCDVGLGSWQSIIVNPGSGSETLVFDYKNCPLDVSGNAYMTVDVNNMGLSDLIVDLSYQGLWEMHLNAGRFVIPESEYTKNNLILFREDVDETSPWFPYFDQVRALPGMHVISWRAFDLKDVRSVSLTLSWENYSGAPFQVLIGAPYGTGNYSFPSISYS
ncbi:MAG: hypothetical protein KAS71_13380, partial [Bacteroidales bacterium]|nr:hypothetical protein [Bacteroidales bacterium]